MKPAIAADSLSEQPAITLLRTTGGLILHQCLYVAATLCIADLLKERAATAAELAGTLHVDEEALYRVLRLLAGQGVFEEIACRTFANSPLSESLRTDVAGSVRSLLIMRGAPAIVAALGELLFSVTTGKPSFEKLYGAELFTHLRRIRSQALVFDDAMTALTALWAPRIATAYEFAPWGSLMDVGGGNGLLLAEILKVHRGLRGVLAEQRLLGRVLGSGEWVQYLGTLDSTKWHSRCARASRPFGLLRLINRDSASTGSLLPRSSDQPKPTLSTPGCRSCCQHQVRGAPHRESSRPATVIRGALSARWTIPRMVCLRDSPQCESKLD